MDIPSLSLERNIHEEQTEEATNQNQKVNMPLDEIMSATASKSATAHGTDVDMREYPNLSPSLSLERIIHERQTEEASNQKVNMSLEEIIHMSATASKSAPAHGTGVNIRKYPKLSPPVSMEPIIHECQTEEASNQKVNMSLEEIIHMRATASKSDRAHGTSVDMREYPNVSPSVSMEPIIHKRQTEEASNQKDNMPLKEIHITATASKSATAHGTGVDMREYPNMSAYRAIACLTGQGILVDVKIGRLREDEGEIDRSHLWQCIIICGEYEGKADSVRKVVAREVAAMQFLQHLSNTNKTIEIPRYKVFDELFIDPKLFHQIEKLADDNNMSVRYQINVKPVPPGLKHRVYFIFVCTCFVGERRFRGEHYIIEYGKLLAAKEAYTFLAGAAPIPTRFFTGEDCNVSTQYIFNESEVYQFLGKLQQKKEAQAKTDSAETKPKTLTERFMELTTHHPTIPDEVAAKVGGVDVNAPTPTSSAKGTKRVFKMPDVSAKARKNVSFGSDSEAEMEVDEPFTFKVPVPKQPLRLGDDEMGEGKGKGHGRGKKIGN